MEEYFNNEQELMQYLIDGGTIRPHFIADRARKDHWLKLVNGNRQLVVSGKSAENYLLGLGYWVKAI
ncbi:MAG: hypothetical protein LHW64_11180 [Candidatus Cloacimonetes bacterium]|nr:hypothetical protein [Candidatus Cloacimonadota bacterium]MDY0230651.1 hypothetical protein [Candidatus Cloacimonadaceae bacterium]